MDFSGKIKKRASGCIQGGNDMELKTVVAEWFENKKYLNDLKARIEKLTADILYFLPHKTGHFQELLSTMTKKTMEGKQVEEQVSLKYHYTAGELEELNRIAPLLEDFKKEVSNFVSRIQPQCIRFAENCDAKDTAHAIHLFFIDNITNEFEKAFKIFQQQLEKTKQGYMDEQIPLSISLITKEWAEDEKQARKEKQAFLVGKTAQIQSAIDMVAHAWSTTYGTSVYSLLSDIRMGLYHELGNIKQKNT